MYEKSFNFMKSGSSNTFANCFFEGEDSSQIILNTLVAKSDSATVVNTWSVKNDLRGTGTTRTATVAANIGATAITVSSQTGIGAGSKIWIKSAKSHREQQIADVASVGGGGVVNLVSPLTGSVAVGDIVMVLENQVDIPVSSNSISILGETVITAERKSPLVVGIYGNNAKIFACGYWDDVN